jgi:Ca2+-transporting ATPase
MEKAFHELGQKIASRGTALRMVHAYGLRPDLLTMAQVWRQTDVEAEFIVAAKGAPEAIADLCRLPPESVETVKREVDAMAGEGLRILGVARAMHPGGDLPRSQREFAFKFLGLVGLADPVRKSVPAAIADCRSAGIRVIMITGDYPTTARAIADKAGLSVQDVFTGDDLEKLSAIELRERVRAATVFARIMPEQKLRIVNALKANGDIVCMTGDGVNDAPSLKAAHIGVAMGGRGTDVAREASSIVLLDDDFGSIVKAIRLGRRIYDNLRKAMGFIFAVHVPIAGLALLPLIFGLPILFGPVHIAFLEMVIDPVCSLVFEAETEEEAVMRRPPRAPDEPLFSSASIVWSLAQGALALGLVGAIFVGAVARGMPDDEVRALAFFSLVLAILSLVFVNRSFSSSLVAAFRRPNAALAWVLVGVTAILTLSLVWAPLAGLLRFGPLHADDLTVTVGAGAAVLLVLEFLKPKFAKRTVS